MPRFMTHTYIPCGGPRARARRRNKRVRASGARIDQTCYTSARLRCGSNFALQGGGKVTVWDFDESCAFVGLLQFGGASRRMRGRRRARFLCINDRGDSWDKWRFIFYLEQKRVLIESRIKCSLFDKLFN